ncbi:uncharacterized protein LOC117169955 [Belonocnema kinseyi]|uniref:uncharacterized protein LOC117169955 n=1 Tax=Belonocnema kinseyi TaxID=2817044 RepID=UPI00143D885A|nr:uncharacterized protein LOC117169955 [Belonocnema kinseyi]
MSTRDELVRRRKILKAQLTRTQTDIQSLTSIDPIDELKERLTKLDEPTGFEEEVDENAEVELRLARARMKTAEALASLSALNTQIPSTSSHVLPEPNPMLNLPKVMLPTFDGSYQQGQSFRDLFKSMIHDQPMNLCLNCLKKTHLGNECDLRGMCNLSLSRLDTQIQKLWHIEDSLNQNPILSSEKARCEELFKKDVTRDGKFIVRLPLRDQIESLGDSFHMAQNRLESVERRVRREARLNELYSAFMKEYKELGHMTAVNGESLQGHEIKYYLPHNAILKPVSRITKLRIVFDGSAKSTSGKSLNDIILVGPTDEQDLLSLVLRFRLHRIVITAEIEEMYRQVWIHQAAPFLATRCLEEISENVKDSNPISGQVIANDFYVDNMITGADSIAEALNLRAQVSTASESVGFNLRKWCSNSEEVISNQRPDSSTKTEMVDLGRPEKSKTLGIRWHPPPNTLQYNRVRYRETLSDLNDIRICRRVISGDYTDLQLHGFYDASEKAYGACIYIRATFHSGESSVRLLCANSRRAPLKQRTLPSLELCAALLLAELFQKVTKSLKVSMLSYFWTDSELVLAYLADEPRRWITLIGKWVSQIQQLTDVSQWRRVPGSSNRADLVSRGVSRAELIDNELLWTGPSWLKLNSDCWPNKGQTPNEVPERRKAAMCHLSVPKWHMIDRFSTPKDLLQETSFFFRFYKTIAGENTKVRNKIITTDEISLLEERKSSQLQESTAHSKSIHRSRRTAACWGRLGNSDRPEDQRGRNAVKNVIRHCMECARAKPISITHQMGHLPADRKKQCRSFFNTRVDYAGPIYIKGGTRCSQTKLKLYVALFVCFRTKAIHLELVTDLTTAAFLTELKNALCNEGIKSHFIPLRSPHLGGLWEAGVRLIKNHLKRILGESFLTFEDYYTVLTQIEACLNSRPITYLSDDPADPLPLTPGHFLIGEALLALLETDVASIPDNKLIIWDRLQKMKQHFWKR